MKESSNKLCIGTAEFAGAEKLLQSAASVLTRPRLFLKTTVLSSLLDLSRKPGKRQQGQDSWVSGARAVLQALPNPSRPSSQPVPGSRGASEGTGCAIQPPPGMVSDLHCTSHWLTSIYSLCISFYSCFIKAQRTPKVSPVLALEILAARTILPGSLFNVRVALMTPSRPGPRGSSGDPVMQLSEESSKAGLNIPVFQSQLCSSALRQKLQLMKSHLASAQSDSRFNGSGVTWQSSGKDSSTRPRVCVGYLPSPNTRERHSAPLGKPRPHRTPGRR